MIRISLGALAALVCAVMVGVAALLAQPVAVEAQSHSASRSFQRSWAAPGSQFQVTITARDYGAFGQVVEELSAGFTYIGNSLGAAHEEVDSQTIRFNLLGRNQVQLHRYRSREGRAVHLLRDYQKHRQGGADHRWPDHPAGRARPDGHTHTRTYGHTNAGAHHHATARTHGDSSARAHGHSSARAHGHANANPYTRADTHSSAYADGHSGAYRDGDCGAYAGTPHGNTGAHGNTDAGDNHCGGAYRNTGADGGGGGAGSRRRAACHPVAHPSRCFLRPDPCRLLLSPDPEAAGHPASGRVGLLCWAMWLGDGVEPSSGCLQGWKGRGQAAGGWWLE